MAFRKENKTKSNFSKISIGLASPEEILENSSGEVLKPETINYRSTNPNVTVCSASAFLVLSRIMNVIAVNTSVSVIKVSSATVVVWKLLKRKCAVNVWDISAGCAGGSHLVFPFAS